MVGKSVVIIGAGLGGLFCGALLSKEGLKVTVLEKNSTIGGGLQSFTRFGEVFDTGMHIIGGMHPGGSIRKICEYLGIMEQVKLLDVDHECTDDVFFAEAGVHYRIAQGREEYVCSLSRYFPDQKDNLRRYVDAMFAVADEVDLFHLRPSSGNLPVHSDDFLMSAQDFIAKYLSDEQLRSVVAYMNPLYGGKNDMTPAYIHSLISVLYINGPSRFVGGSSLFADILRDFIENHGGCVKTSEAVMSINTKGRFVTGVSTEKGESYVADYYISDIHPCTLFTLFEDRMALPGPYRDRLDNIPNAYSAFTLNIKLKPCSFRYFNYSSYYIKRYDDMWKFDFNDGVWPRGFLYMTPPELEQGEYATKMIVTAPMLWSEVKKWEDTTVGHRGKDYEKWKDKCAGKLLECMEELYPGFGECIENVNTASPLTIRDFYGVKEGSMCGFSKDYRNLIMSQVPIITKIPNLLLTGQNCNLHGFCGVALTSVNTCEAILGRNCLIDKINSFAAAARK